MPEDTGSFEHALETDIERLGREVNAQRERPELKNANERELIKEAIRAFPEVTRNPSPIPAPAPIPASQNPLPDYAANAPAEVKLEIEYLLDVTFRGGIGKALAEAQKSSPFVQDAFHDALAGKLYPILQKRGMVK